MLEGNKLTVDFVGLSLRRTVFENLNLFSKLPQSVHPSNDAYSPNFAFESLFFGAWQFFGDASLEGIKPRAEENSTS